MKVIIKHSFEKATMNSLVVGDRFTHMNNKNKCFIVTKIDNSIIYYFCNGQEGNCRYDEGPCFKVNILV
jgi:hypothetical protein